ncbi:MAG TPA: fibronectin type III domain-containing protein [Flavobacterium sp.]|uniref:T9SS type A sorting domain-containing protein n=1 Tax=Flavobacterium sp. TaxID=239 RepID=UPI002B4AEDBB|nr:fibronectin type III domain-containing protein [Flavobacterium sp.]HLO74185.1 fibronectin type III domain-containing protein [Flavobacterium sp.]
MKKRITLFCLLAFLYLIPNAVAQCTTATNGLFPANTYTPNCSGNYETITSQSWTGEYSNVNVIANKQYSFSSSVATDYITITNGNGTIVYASGTQPVIWDSGSTTGVIRYYLHSNTNCSSEQVNRSRYIRCADASNCVPPSNLAVSNITSNSCKITWTAASPVPSSNYDIYIVTTNSAPTANSTPTLFSTTNLTTTMYLNVAAGTTYYYWIRSNCGATTGVWVSGGNFTTPPALTCNGAIYGLYPDATFTPACTGNTEQIVADAYAGEYSNVNVLSNKQYTFTSSISTDFITITNATGTTVLASGLTPLTWLSGSTSGVVRYHLNANSSCGTQNTNRVRSITCATISVCNAPTQLFYDGLTSSSNNIAWTAPNPAPSNGYVYCYSTVNDPFSANAITGTTTDTFAVLNNLLPNTTYYFWVKSNCGQTQTNWVSGGSFTTYPASGCNAPTQLFYDGLTSTSNNIAWVAPTPAPSNGYVYCYSTINDPFSANAITGTTTDTFAVLNNLSPNTTYYFWVKSNCGNTQTNWVSGGSFTTYPASGCNEPTQLFYDGLTSTSNNIAWVAPTPAPSNGYVYCYSTVNDPFSANAITGTTTDTFAVLNNLSPNTTYYFWVKSNCGQTQTNWVSGGSFTTYPASGCNEPTQLFYDGLTSTSNNIAWVEATPTPSNGYVYCYSTINDPFSANAITGTTTDTFAVLNNLSPNTTYYFWVKSNCGQTQTNWVSGGSFTTQMLTTESFSMKNLKLYPIPVKDILNLSFDKEITTVSIYNLLGQEVLSKLVNNNETSIDFTDVSAGTYFAKVTSNNEVKTAKIIKQ